MPDYMSEPAFQTIIKSPEFGRFSPEKRSAVMQALGKLTPEERQQFAESLPAGPPSSEQINAGVERFLEPSTFDVKHVAPVIAGAAIGGGIGAGGAALAGRVASPLIKAALPAVSEMAGNYLGNQAVKGMGLAEGEPFGDPTMGDVLSVGIPGVVRGAAGIAKAFTKPAQTAIREADQKVADFKGAVQTHANALTEIPASVEAQTTLENPQAKYNASKMHATASSQPVPLTEFEGEAARLGVQLQHPAPGLQSRYQNLTNTLGEWSEGDQPVQRVLATHNKLGGLIGKLRRGGGEELGVAKELYGAISEDMKSYAAANPNTSEGKAIGAYLEGQAAQRKQWAMDDFKELFDVKKGYTNVPGVGKDVKSGQILDNWEQLVNKNRFYKGSFTSEELEAQREALTKLPLEKIPSQPSGKPEIGSFPAAQAIMLKSVGGMLGGALLTGNQTAGYIGGAAAGAGLAAAPWLVKKIMLSGPKGEAIVRNIMAGKQTVGPQELAALTAAARHLGVDIEDTR